MFKRRSISENTSTQNRQFPRCGRHNTDCPLRVGPELSPMKPIFHPQLVNDSFGDPALYVEFLFEKRALLFDLGDISSLATRRVLRLSHIFVSHTHMDHFMGFDRMLRMCPGRDKALHLWGPPGFIERVVDGQKIAYVVDVVYHEENARRIVDLAGDADFLFIETTFLEEDVHLAAEKYHLTARQAGMLVSQAAVKRLIPFHFSARYPDRSKELEAEAREAWKSVTG